MAFVRATMDMRIDMVAVYDEVLLLAIIVLNQIVVVTVLISSLQANLP
jgi:hypothetical protein